MSSPYKIGAVINQRYKLEKEIGRGGMESVIYLATDQSITNDRYLEMKRKKVAIKIVCKKDFTDDDDREEKWNKLRDETVTGLRATSMPNIVHTYDVIYDDQNECIIIVMEFIDGQSLRQILDQHGYLSVKEGLYIILKVVEAINSLHRLQHKIIHRDLKPENIMITKDFTEIKIIDFGISSVVNIHEHKALTSEDTLYGTYAYMSPDIYRMAQYVDSKKRKGEVVNDHAEMITEQFDFHSIGVILYETITGTKPFWYHTYDEGKEAKNIIYLCEKYDIYPMNKLDANIPNGIENIIFRCLASKPNDRKYRYQNAQAIIDDLLRVKNNFKAAFGEKLIKPVNKRVYSSKLIFNLDRERNTQKFYEQFWFIGLLLLVTAIVVIITVVLI